MREFAAPADMISKAIRILNSIATGASVHNVSHDRNVRDSVHLKQKQKSVSQKLQPQCARKNVSKNQGKRPNGKKVPTMRWAKIKIKNK